MPVISTRFFGELQYEAEAVFYFPSGIPGFEEYQQFLLIERAETRPLLFMQSCRNASLCFVAAPVSVAEPAYALELALDEVAMLDLPPESETVGATGSTCCIGLITSSPGEAPTINLASPIVLNLQNRKGVQAVRADAQYSRRHPL